MAGRCFSGIVDTAMEEVYKENLKYAAKLLEEKGIVGLIEPISMSITGLSNYFLHSFSKGIFFYIYSFYIF